MIGWLLVCLIVYLFIFLLYIGLLVIIVYLFVYICVYSLSTIGALSQHSIPASADTTERHLLLYTVTSRATLSEDHSARLLLFLHSFPDAAVIQEQSVPRLPEGELS